MALYVALHVFHVITYAKHTTAFNYIYIQLYLYSVIFNYTLLLVSSK